MDSSGAREGGVDHVPGEKPAEKPRAIRCRYGVGWISMGG